MTIRNIDREKSVVESDALGGDENTEYRLWCDPNSPYSCKLRTYLNYREIPYKRQRINITAYMEDIPAKVGMPIMPVLMLADDTVLQDTTPIMTLLESKHSQRICIPEDNDLQFLMWLLEDFGDEYLARFSMHYRWGNKISRETLSHRLSRSMCYGMGGMHATELAPMILERQSGFDEPLGLNAEGARESLDRQLIDLLSILDKHFERYQFILGGRPSLADFAIYGHMMAHLYQDPFSAQLMERHGSRVCNWLDTITEFGDARGQVAQTEFGPWLDLSLEVPSTLRQLLSFVAKTYIPFACGVAKACEAGDKFFTAKIYDVDTRFRGFQYRAWSFENVQKKFLELNCSDVLNSLLNETNVQPVMMQNGVFHCTLFDGFTPPVIQGGVADARAKYLKQRQEGVAT